MWILSLTKIFQEVLADLENYLAIMLERKPFKLFFIYILEVTFYLGDLCVNEQIKTNWNLVYKNIYQVCYIQN